jgi:PBP1b-binding outer membrane lipoprotein LpoB
MFKNKGVKPTEKQVVVETKISNPSIHMLDVNMAIIESKVTEQQMFRIESQLKSQLLTRKRRKDYNNFLSRLYRRCK